MIPPLLALFVWPLVSIVFFRTMKVRLAVIVTVLGGYLLLPERTTFDLPLLPSLDKHTIPALTAILLAAAFRSAGPTEDIRPGLIPRHWMIRLLLLVLVLSAFLTAMTNPDSIFYPLLTLPGLRPYDAFSIVLSAIMSVLPLLLARKYLADSGAQGLMIAVLCIAASGYSLLALFEVRMSPQLNYWTYGFFPHAWIQHIRNGGFRPLVFLSHGLVLGIFLVVAMVTTIGLLRVSTRKRAAILLAILLILVTLLLSKNLGATMIAIAVLPAAVFLGARGQLLVAAILSGIVLSYPILRSTHVLPIEEFVTFVEGINEERASSLQTRLDNEERMLAKAAERPLVGWGGWGRSRVYDETGIDITIADGYWIIVLGVDGWLGYLARMGLLTAPIFLLLFRGRRADISLESSIIALALAANIADLVPNSSATPLTWLLAGSLWGRLELRNVTAADAPSEIPSAQRSGYRRSVPESVSVSAAEVPEGLGDRASDSPYTRQKRRITRRGTSTDTS